MSWSVTELAELLTTQGVWVLEVGDDEIDVALSGQAPEDPHRATVRLVGSGGDRLLVLDVTYPFEARDVTQARLGAAVVAPYLVLGHTEVDDDGSVHHRYAMAVEAEQLPAHRVLLQTISVLNYEQVHFGDYLEELCTGRTRLDTFARLVAAGEASGID